MSEAFEISMDDMKSAFKEERDKHEAWMKDPNRKEHQENERTIDMGDHHFTEDESDVTAHQERERNKVLGKDSQT